MRKPLIERKNRAAGVSTPSRKDQIENKINLLSATELTHPDKGTGSVKSTRGENRNEDGGELTLRSSKKSELS